MSTLKELLEQKATLEKLIADTRQSELAEAVSKVKGIIAQYGLTQDDIFGTVRSSKKVKTAGAKVAAKYRDPVTGKEWSGRGLAPKWMAGKSKEDFLIA